MRLPAPRPGPRRSRRGLHRRRRRPWDRCPRSRAPRPACRQRSHVGRPVAAAPPPADVERKRSLDALSPPKKAEQRARPGMSPGGGRVWCSSPPASSHPYRAVNARVPWRSWVLCWSAPKREWEKWRGRVGRRLHPAGRAECDIRCPRGTGSTRRSRGIVSLPWLVGGSTPPMSIRCRNPRALRPRHECAPSPPSTHRPFWRAPTLASKRSRSALSLDVRRRRRRCYRTSNV